MPEPIKLDDPGNTPASPSTNITIGASSGNDAPAKNGGSMGNIFTQKKDKKEDSKMITSIISQKDVAKKTKSILGPAPALEKSIEQEKEASMKRKLRLYQFVFLIIFVASVAMAFYFYSELSPDFTLFGSNTTQRLADTNTNLKQVQTLVNKDRYLTAQLQLNEFSYQADRFFSSVAKVNDPTVSSLDKGTALADLGESQTALPVLLGSIRDILSNDIVIPTYRSDKEPEQTDNEILLAAQTDLRSALTDEKKKYGQNPTDPQDILDVKLIDNASKLVGNKTLLNALQSTSTDAFQKQLADYVQSPDPQKLTALQTVIGKVLSSTKSDLATIADIKRSRIQWSTVITQIKDETINVDKNFGQPFLYDTLGGIIYTGYEFDSAANKIVLSGTTKTRDGSNFTLISNLIDQLENSQYFQDVNMRSFSKSKSGIPGDESFTANFKIDLSLETSGFSDKNAPVNLQSTIPQATASGTKRTTASSQEATAQSAVPAGTTQAVTSSSAAAPAPAPVPANPAGETLTSTQEASATASATQENSSSTSTETPSGATGAGAIPTSLSSLFSSPSSP